MYDPILLFWEEQTILNKGFHKESSQNNIVQDSRSHIETVKKIPYKSLSYGFMLSVLHILLYKIEPGCFRKIHIQDVVPFGKKKTFDFSKYFV